VTGGDDAVAVGAIGAREVYAPIDAIRAAERALVLTG
jgi:hypothetical protein